MPKKLTKGMVDSLKPQPERDVFLWCGEIRGFGVRVKPSGTKTFFIQYRNSRRRTRRYAIGQYGKWTVEQARREARSKLVEAEKGGDPSAERKAAAHRKVKTVGELCAQYLVDAKAGRVLHRGKPKKKTTLTIDEGRIRCHIMPLLGDSPLDEVKRQDIERLLYQVSEGATAVDLKTKPRGRARVTGGRGTATKAVKLLGAIFNYAIRKGFTDQNPCTGVEKPADGVRSRFLNAGEYGRFGEGLRKAEQEGVNQTALQAIEALALTGCREGEILNLQPGEIDVAGRCLRLRDTKTGAQMRPCGRAALDFIGGVAEGAEGEWGFPSTRRTGSLVETGAPLARVCEIAELDGVTLHVLRHSYATTAHELNYSELTIAALLGHSAGSVTAKYAHAVDSAIAGAADRVSATINARLKGAEQSGKVISFTGSDGAA